MSGRSIVTNSLSCIIDWTEILDSIIPVNVVYLDFSRAFDPVPHKRLLLKLEHLGIRVDLLHWIGAFLTQHSFRVCVGEAMSGARGVLSGVPHGSVMGSLSFLLYT